MDYCLLKLSEDAEKYERFTQNQYRPLTQHSLEWQRLLGSFSQWEWNALGVIEDTELIGCVPFCVSRTELGSVLMSSPASASYSGVLHVADCNREAVYDKLCKGLVIYAKDHNIDIVSIFSSPFRNDLDLYNKYLKPDYSMKKFYQYIPGNTEIGTISNSKFRNNLNRNLNKALKHGFEIMLLDNPDEKIFDNWYDNVLLNRMDQIGGAVLSRTFLFNMIEQLLPTKQLEFAYIAENNNIISGGIFLFGYAEDIYFRASTDKAMRDGIGMYIDWHMIKRGLDKNVSAINFQGSPSRESESYGYKKRWGCLEDETAYMIKITGDIKPFIKAGKEKVTEMFPHYFVLPYSVYGE